MKIFFLASIQATPEEKKTFKTIIRSIEDSGHTVLADYLFSVTEADLREWQGTKEMTKFHRSIFDQIKRADIVLVEATQQRISLGYFLSMAFENGKPALVVVKKGHRFPLLETLERGDKLESLEYSTLDELLKKLPEMIQFVAGHQDTRFNFFISPRQQRYLDWVARKRRIPRSVLLRRLIEGHMSKNMDYQGHDI